MLRAPLFLLAAGFGLIASSSQPSAAPSSMLTPRSGVEVIDYGTLVISGSRFGRTETFEMVRRPDGGRTITSVTTAADGSYRVQGRWDYDAEERALSAHGRGLLGGQAVTIDIAAAPPAATMRVTAVDEAVRTFHAPCDPACLIDMTPSALPMFTMTRLYDFETGGVQTFRWIGHALNQDQRLTDGTVRFSFVKEVEVEQPNGDLLRVRHFIWDETLVEENSGRTFEVHFNAWTDTNHRPLKFVVGTSTTGIREGYQSISDQLVAE